MKPICIALICLGITGIAVPPLCGFLDALTGHDGQMALFLGGFLYPAWGMTVVCLVGSLVCRFMLKPQFAEPQLANIGIAIGIVGVAANVSLVWLSF